MIYRGVPSLYVFILPVGTLDLLFGGGGGGGGGGGYFVMFCFHVLVLVVYRIVNCVRI